VAVAAIVVHVSPATTIATDAIALIALIAATAAPITAAAPAPSVEIPCIHRQAAEAPDEEQEAVERGGMGGYLDAAHLLRRVLRGLR
jgi:hypothetical protein